MAVSGIVDTIFLTIIKADVLPNNNTILDRAIVSIEWSNAFPYKKEEIGIDEFKSIFGNKIKKSPDGNNKTIPPEESFDLIFEFFDKEKKIITKKDWDSFFEKNAEDGKITPIILIQRFGAFTIEKLKSLQPKSQQNTSKKPVQTTPPQPVPTTPPQPVPTTPSQPVPSTAKAAGGKRNKTRKIKYLFR